MLVGVTPPPPSFLPTGTQAFYFINRPNDRKRMISSNFVAFSEYMNFIRLSSHIYLYPQMGPPFLEMAAATQFWHVTAAVQPFKAVITKATARLLYAAVLLNFSWQPLCIMAASFVIVFFISHNSQVYRKKQYE